MKNIHFVIYLIVTFCQVSIAQELHNTNTIYFDKLIDSCKIVALNTPDSAIKICNMALNEGRKHGDSNMVAIAFNSYALIEIIKGNHDCAEEFCFKALSNADSIVDPLTLGNINNNLAKIYKDQQLYEKSLIHYFKSLSIRKIHHDTIGQVGSLINIGVLYSAMNNIEFSLNYYLKASELIKNNNELQTLGALYNNIAVAYKRLGDKNLAIEYYKKAQNLFKQLDCKKYQANILSNIGALLESENNDSALHYYKSALSIHNKINNQYGIALTKINIALVLKDINQFSEAEKLLSESEKIAQKIESSRLLEFTYDAFKDLYEKNNDYKKAFYYYQKNREIVDSIFSIEKNKQITELETKYQTSQKEKEIKSLHKDNEIQKLQLEENIQRTKAQRRLFLVFAFILISIVLVIWFIYKNYKKQQIIKQQNLKYQKLASEQKMLRSQMNPHFIYNSLNSIQSFISSEQSYEAEKYLAKFAKLIRGILENSRVDFISLDKEIEVLELYLSLEQLRFENRFIYNIQVEENIEEEFISIPPMLVQPFVENAILHGFQNRTNGKININFMEKEDYIICEIDDNGVGRNNSEEKQTKKKHQSLATTITQERLDALSHELKKEAWFTIEDKIDPKTQKPLGTKVILQIPFIEN